MLEINSKDIKDIYDYNQLAKNIFKAYYLRYNGDAASTPDNHKADSALSFIRSTLPIYKFFQMLQLTPSDMLYVDGVAMYKALNKKTRVESIYIMDSIVNIVTTNLDANKGMNYPEIGGKVHVPVAKVYDVEKDFSKGFELNSGLLEVDFHMVDATELVEDILDKKIITVTNNGFSVTMAKPLLPGLSKNSELYVSFQPYKDGHFKAHFRIQKEQVINYHTYIAYAIFN